MTLPLVLAVFLLELSHVVQQLALVIQVHAYLVGLFGLLLLQIHQLAQVDRLAGIQVIDPLDENVLLILAEVSYGLFRNGTVAVRDDYVALLECLGALGDRQVEHARRVQSHPNHLLYLLKGGTLHLRQSEYLSVLDIVVNAGVLD